MPQPKNPISDKQQAANRANAAKSTGPRTPEGKARSSRNAVKHGFTASTFAVVRLEDLQEIARFKSDLIHDYQPVNAQELFALERMALAQQCILRAARLEAGLFTTFMNDSLSLNDHEFSPMSIEMAGDGDIDVTRAQNRNYCLADGFVMEAKKSNVISLFLRYQAQAERQYRRALEEFERLKALRPEMPNEPIEDLQPEENPDDYLIQKTSESDQRPLFGPDPEGPTPCPPGPRPSQPSDPTPSGPAPDLPKAA